MVILLVGLAGCLGPSTISSANVEPRPSTPTGPAAMNNTTVVLAPVWRVGDAWETTSQGGGRATLVVTAASGEGYALSTDDPTLAGYDAMLDVSYVGRIRASDLAGAQHDKPVAFFAFPMQDGSRWSATWDGLSVVMTATYSPSIATAGGSPGFSIVAQADGKPYATYDYVPALKWWSHLEFAAGYGLTVSRHVENWTGQVVTATAKEVFNSTTVFPVATLNTQTFHVDERQTFLQATFSGGAKTYARGYQLVDPNNTAYPSGGPATDAQPSGGGVYVSAQYPAAPGDWKVSAPVAHTNDGYFVMTVHEVALASRPFP